VLLSISFVVVVISYADLFGVTRLRWWKEYRDAWTLYSVGQLHRQVAEQQCGTLHNAHPSSTWPDLRSGHASGFAVLERNGSKYLATGMSYSLLVARWLISLLILQILV
jgi:hypothetical protein